MSTFKVQKDKCNQCLFSSNKIVSDESKKQILEECLEDNKHFVCHKSSIADNGKVCCKGFFDNFKNQIAVIELAKILNLIEYVKIV